MYLEGLFVVSDLREAPQMPESKRRKVGRLLVKIIPVHLLLVMALVSKMNGGKI